MASWDAWDDWEDGDDGWQSTPKNDARAAAAGRSDLPGQQSCQAASGKLAAVKLVPTKVATPAAAVPACSSQGPHLAVRSAGLIRSENKPSSPPSFPALAPVPPTHGLGPTNSQPVRTAKLGQRAPTKLAGILPAQPASPEASSLHVSGAQPPYMPSTSRAQPTASAAPTDAQMPQLRLHPAHSAAEAAPGAPPSLLPSVVMHKAPSAPPPPQTTALTGASTTSRAHSDAMAGACPRAGTTTTHQGPAQATLGTCLSTPVGDGTFPKPSHPTAAGNTKLPVHGASAASAPPAALGSAAAEQPPPPASAAAVKRAASRECAPFSPPPPLPSSCPPQRNLSSDTQHSSILAPAPVGVRRAHASAQPMSKIP
eukprot:6173409-Pleurochrysis_carterae.AAC.2